MICNNCREKIGENALFCSRCGEKVLPEIANVQNSEETKIPLREKEEAIYAFITGKLNGENTVSHTYKKYHEILGGPDLSIGLNWSWSGFFLLGLPMLYRGCWGAHFMYAILFEFGYLFLTTYSAYASPFLLFGLMFIILMGFGGTNSWIAARYDWGCIRAEFEYPDNEKKQIEYLACKGGTSMLKTILFLAVEGIVILLIEILFTDLFIEWFYPLRTIGIDFFALSYLWPLVLFFLASFLICSGYFALICSLIKMGIFFLIHRKDLD